MNTDITWIFIGLGALILLIGITWGRAERKIRKLESENQYLKEGINLSAKIIGNANILNVPPKDLPEDFDK